jgi:hypothetical protein
MPFFNLTHRGPRPDLKTHPVVLEGLRKAVAQGPLDGRSDAEIRQRLLEELCGALPERPAGLRGWQVLEADWQQVLDAILNERP